MKNPPPLTVGVNTQAGLYGVAGFDDFDLWMRRNVAHYKVVSDQAEGLGMNDADRLRMLLAAMSVKALAHEEKIVEMVRTAGAPPFVTVKRCPNDTDGDGDCHLCHNKGGCPNR